MKRCVTCFQSPIIPDLAGGRFGPLPTRFIHTLLEGQRFERPGESQSIQTDVRIIAATNPNLKKMVKEKQFRNDLHCRIPVFPVQIPPLREHREDIAVVANHFIRKYSQAFGRKTAQLTPSDLKKPENINGAAISVNSIPMLLFDYLGFLWDYWRQNFKP